MKLGRFVALKFLPDEVGLPASTRPLKNHERSQIPSGGPSSGQGAGCDGQNRLLVVGDAPFSSRVKGIGGRSRSIYKVEANLDWIHKPRLGDVLASKLVPIHGKLGV
jgi:hypothetical protein